MVTKASVRLLVSLGCVILAFAGNAQACAICFSGLVVTPGQRLDAADQAVIAAPVDGQGRFRVMEIVKGDGTVGDVLVQPGLATPVAEAVMSVDGLTVADGEGRNSIRNLCFSSTTRFPRSGQAWAQCPSTLRDGCDNSRRRSRAQRRQSAFGRN
ncbi:hypothetical protein [Rhizobium sp. F40D2]